MRLILPWPDKRLFPNWKRAHHWRTYRNAEQAAKASGAALVYEAALGGLRELRLAYSGEGKVGYRVTFYPPDYRRRDDDGMVGAIKHHRDGICAALGFDDSRLKPHYFFAEPQKPGRVEIELSPPIHSPAREATDFASRGVNGSSSETETA